MSEKLLAISGSRASVRAAAVTAKRQTEERMLKNSGTILSRLHQCIFDPTTPIELVIKSCFAYLDRIGLSPMVASRPAEEPPSKNDLDHLNDAQLKQRMCDIRDGLQKLIEQQDAEETKGGAVVEKAGDVVDAQVVGPPVGNLSGRDGAS